MQTQATVAQHCCVSTNKFSDIIMGQQWEHLDLMLQNNGTSDPIVTKTWQTQMDP
jgi:hypothetical protein